MYFTTARQEREKERERKRVQVCACVVCGDDSVVGDPPFTACYYYSMVSVFRHKNSETLEVFLHVFQLLSTTEPGVEVLGEFSHQY